jgi:hypothetical protein
MSDRTLWTACLLCAHQRSNKQGESTEVPPSFGQSYVDFTSKAEVSPNFWNQPPLLCVYSFLLLLLSLTFHSSKPQVQPRSLASSLGSTHDSSRSDPDRPCRIRFFFWSCAAFFSWAHSYFSQLKTARASKTKITRHRSTKSDRLWMTALPRSWNWTSRSSWTPEDLTPEDFHAPGLPAY